MSVHAHAAYVVSIGGLIPLAHGTACHAWVEFFRHSPRAAQLNHYRTQSAAQRVLHRACRFELEIALPWASLCDRGYFQAHASWRGLTAGHADVELVKAGVGGRIVDTLEPRRKEHRTLPCGIRRSLGRPQIS